MANTKLQMEIKEMDPELLKDKLPQPYRFISKLLDGLISDVIDWVHFPTKNIQEHRKMEAEKTEELNATIFNPIQTFEGSDIGNITSIIITPDEKFIIAGNSTGQLFSISLQGNNYPICAISAHGFPISHIDVGSRKNSIIVVSSSQENSKESLFLKAHCISEDNITKGFQSCFSMEFPVQYQAFPFHFMLSRDTTYLATILQDGSVQLYFIREEAAENFNSKGNAYSITPFSLNNLGGSSNSVVLVPTPRMTISSSPQFTEMNYVLPTPIFHQSSNANTSQVHEGNSTSNDTSCGSKSYYITNATIMTKKKDTDTEKTTGERGSVSKKRSIAKNLTLHGNSAQYRAEKKEFSMMHGNSHLTGSSNGSFGRPITTFINGLGGETCGILLGWYGHNIFLQ
jgi:hypothetical protein